MNKLLLMLCCFTAASLAGFCQPKKPKSVKMDCCTLAGNLDYSNAVGRIKGYGYKKSVSYQDNLNDYVGYDAIEFSEMLQMLKADTNCDGLRIYLAELPSLPCTSPDLACNLIPKDNKGPVTFIFAPTQTNAVNSNVHDDEKIYWVMLNGTVQPIDEQAASNWVKKAIGGYLDSFLVDGKRINVNFSESHALWYDKALLAGTPPPNKCTVLDYLACSKSDSVYIFLGAFDHMLLPPDEGDAVYDYFYQLTLLFEMHLPNTSFFGDGSVIASLSYPYVKKKDAPKDKNPKSPKKDPDSYADTGRPCPPPGCPGAALFK